MPLRRIFLKPSQFHSLPHILSHIANGQTVEMYTYRFCLVKTLSLVISVAAHILEHGKYIL